MPDAAAAWPGSVEDPSPVEALESVEYLGPVEDLGPVAGEVVGAEVEAAEPESADLPLWDWSPPGESVPEDEPTVRPADPPRAEWKLVVTPVEEVEGPQPPGIGQHRGNLAHLAADPKMRVWELRVVVAVVIVVAFSILVSWRWGLTLAVLAVVADAIYRSRRRYDGPGKVRLTGAQRRPAGS